MRIVIDIGSAGEPHFIDTAPGRIPVAAHPTGGPQPADWLAWLTVMNANPVARANGGWGVMNQLPGELAPMTRWARLVAAANAATADANVKALALSGS